MLYLPDKSYLGRFKQLVWPLPHKLLPWLYTKGLAIYILPKNKKDVKNLVKKLGIVEEKIKGDGRQVSETAQYRPEQKIILLPHKALYRAGGENILLHELGHAIDFLYYDNTLLSNHSKIWCALRPDKPLNDYCKRRYKERNDLVEQFATSFSAFFSEPDDVDIKPNIEDLDPTLIRIFQKNLIKPFE